MIHCLARHFLFPLLIVLFCADAPGAAMAETDTGILPVYHIPLRVHLGNSRRPSKQWLTILREINSIWLTQAGICFEMQVVNHDEKIKNGLDIWFDDMIPDWNGYYYNHHNIHVRDNPDLRQATNPARSSAARTAAHELGHALSLDHRQDSDDNLMRSKTYGWLLHPDEISLARKNARDLSIADTEKGSCRIQIDNEP